MSLVINAPGRGRSRGAAVTPASAMEMFIAGLSPCSLAQYPGTNINEMESSNYLGESLCVLESAGNYPLTNWPGKFGYDPATRLLTGVGTSQGFSSQTPPGSRSKAVYFDMDINRFSIVWGPTSRNEGHVYCGNTSLPMGGYFFRRGYFSNVVWRMDSATREWAAFVDTTSFTGSTEQVVALESFPGLGALGSLILVGATGKVWRYDIATATGSLLTTVAGTANYCVAIYVPAANKLVLGGGGGASRLYTLDASGVVAEIAQTLPDSVEVACDSDSGPAVADPVNASLLVFSHVTQKIWSLNINTGAWTERLAFPGGFTGRAVNSVATALHGLGAVALWYGAGRLGGITQSEFWIFKA